MRNAIRLVQIPKNTKQYLQCHTVICSDNPGDGLVFQRQEKGGVTRETGISERQGLPEKREYQRVYFLKA